MYLWLPLIAVGLIPLGWAWRVNNSCSLVHALSWGVIAWLAWGAALMGGPQSGTEIDAAGYLAICLTGCAGIAVLGARRPHAGVWNFVVLGLLAVMVLPLAENYLLGPKPLGTLRIVFVGATLAVTVLNYLPTCFGWAAVLLGLGGASEILALVSSEKLEGTILAGRLSVLAVPWLAWWGWRRQSNPASVFDRCWLAFRNRYGLLWAQRVREQFNNTAYHGHWPVRLYWQGLMRTTGTPTPEPPAQTVMVDTLRALVKRFE